MDLNWLFRRSLGGVELQLAVPEDDELDGQLQPSTERVKEESALAGIEF